MNISSWPKLDDQQSYYQMGNLDVVGKGGSTQLSDMFPIYVNAPFKSPLLWNIEIWRLQ